MNALETYRVEKKLTFEGLARVCGAPKPSVWRHCTQGQIPGAAALLYHARLGIPLEELRPDLYGTHPTPQPETETAA